MSLLSSQKVTQADDITIFTFPLYNLLILPVLVTQTGISQDPTGVTGKGSLPPNV